MAAPESRAPVPRAFLEHVARPLLARLLAPHVEALRAHGFSVDALAATAQIDHTQVDVLWRLLGAPPPALFPLHADLTAVADASHGAAHDRFVALDPARVVDAELGHEDCAAVVFLDHPELFRKVRAQAGSVQPKAFASFAPKAPRRLPADLTAANARFEAAMLAALEQRGRGLFFHVHVSRRATERHLELVYGRLPASQTLLGKGEGEAAHKVTAQVTQRTTDRAYAVFHDDTLRFDVAGPDWIKELTRRCFGEAYFGDAAHFGGGEVLTLAPLQGALEAALRADDVPGLRKAELREAWVDFGDAGWVAVGAKGDCTAGTLGRYLLRALADGAPCEATFLLHLAARTRPVPLKVALPTRLEHARSDPKVVRVVRDFLVARGYMTLPAHLAGAADGAREMDDG